MCQTRSTWSQPPRCSRLAAAGRPRAPRWPWSWRWRWARVAGAALAAGGAPWLEDEDELREECDKAFLNEAAAKEAARWLHDKLTDHLDIGDAIDVEIEAKTRWPWLEDEDE